MPNTMKPAPLPSVYQLRVVVRGVSPLIWRRLLIPADTTIASLHALLQIAFGWTGTHLHRFVVQGREYGIAYVGGPSFSVTHGRFGWAILACGAPKDSPTTMTSPPGGVLICGSSRCWAPSRAGAFRSVPMAAVPVRRRTAAGCRPSSKAPSPITS